MALEFLLLCLRMLYFCMAIEQIGALLRMVLIVIKVGSFGCAWQWHGHVFSFQQAVAVNSAVPN